MRPLCRSQYLHTSTALKLPRSLQFFLITPELPSILSPAPLMSPHDQLRKKQKRQQCRQGAHTVTDVPPGQEEPHLLSHLKLAGNSLVICLAQVCHLKPLLNICFWKHISFVLQGFGKTFFHHDLQSHQNLNLLEECTDFNSMLLKKSFYIILFRI